MANLYYRSGTTPSVNSGTLAKGSALTNAQLDGNFIGIQLELDTKAPINNASFTGYTNIPGINASGGVINAVTIGDSTPAAATFSTLTANSTSTFNGSISVANTPSITAATVANAVGLFNTSTGTINIGASASTLVTGGDLTVSGGDISISGTPNVRAGTVANTVGLFDTSTGTINIGAASNSTTAIRGIANVTGAATLSSTLGVTGATTLSSTLGVTGATTLSSTLGVTGATTLNNNVTMVGIATAATEYFTITNGSVDKFKVDSANGNTTISGTLGVSGATTLAGLSATTGSFSSTLGVTGTTTLAGMTATTGSFSSTLGVTGATTLSSTLGVTGVTTLAGMTATTGSFSSTLGVTGATTLAAMSATTGSFSSTLGVSGATTLAAMSATTGSFSNVLTSTVATNTAPFTIASTTKVNNLNVDRVDDYHVAEANTVSTIVARDANSKILFTTAGLSGATSGVTTLAASAIASGTVTLPAATDTLVGRATTDTLTNKSISFTNNTITCTSAELATAVSDETGTGKLVFATSPALTTPDIGAATGTSLAATGNVGGSTLSSSVAVGTSPMTITSTTKVSNLNVDRVDDISFSTGAIVAGALPYVNSTAANNHVVAFTTAGVAGTILSSTGGSAPVWISPSGLSAGSSYSASHLNGTGNGDTFYQSALSANLTTTLNSNTATVSNATGIFAGQILFGNPNVPDYAKIDSVVGTTLTLSVNATASGSAVATTFFSTSKLAIGTSGKVYTSNGTSPQWSDSLTLAGTMQHNGLVPTAGTSIDQIYSATDAALVVGTSWVDTSVNAAELASGSYMVQVTTGSGASLEVHTGVMSWFAGDANSAAGDEIVLHRASSGDLTSSLFLKVFRNATVTTDMVLMISSSAARASASYTYKFRRMI